MTKPTMQVEGITVYWCEVKQDWVRTMKLQLLKSEREWLKWRGDNIFDGDIAERPKEFPCYVYTVVLLWSCQKEEARYLYESDLKQMLASLTTTKQYESILEVRGE